VAGVLDNPVIYGPFDPPVRNHRAYETAKPSRKRVA